MLGKSRSELAWDLVLMGAWAIYASLFLRRLMSGGGAVEFGQVAAVTVFTALFLLRRPARCTSTTWETMLALAGTFLPTATRPAPGNLLAWRDHSDRWLNRHRRRRYLSRAQLRYCSRRPRPADDGSLRMGSASPLRDGDLLLRRIRGRQSLVVEFGGPDCRHRPSALPSSPRRADPEGLRPLCGPGALAAPSTGLVATSSSRADELLLRTRRWAHQGDAIGHRRVPGRRHHPGHQRP